MVTPSCWLGRTTSTSLDHGRLGARDLHLRWDQAQFSTDNASVNGVLTIALTPASSGAAKPYLGVEMRSLKTLTYGKVSTRMRFAAGSGVVSGLVLFYTPFPNCNWERDRHQEHLGKSSDTSQLNTMVYLGSPDPNCTTSVSPTPDPLVVSLGFNAETDYHLYDIEWTPAGVQFFGDGALLRTWTKNINLLTLPQRHSPDDLGVYRGGLGGGDDPELRPQRAVDWIKVYDWKG